ncbi:MAG: OprO/OprP family phosphate-selective porin [Dysgonamonadaceae bacterium]|jgi:hypothetical protein|nr:OprO/OprP family phosphate-selective porin [Dysgonamonadaceae bacterium]
MKKLTFTFVFSLIICVASAQEITRKYKKAFQSEQFNLIGYGQAVANFNQHPEAGMVPTNSNSSFDIQRIILFATGKIGVQNKFGYMIMLDAGPNISMQELYGEYIPSDAINVRFGQYKIPFTIENPMSASRFETVYPSRSVSAMAGSSGDFNQFDGRGVKAGRDVGIMLSGKIQEKDGYHLLEYYAGLFNGTGLNTKDNNNHKDIIGTAYIQPLKGLKLGGSVYSGAITTDSVNGLPAGLHRRNAYAAGGVFDNRNFYVRSEYIANKTGNIRRHGFYASGVWKFVPQKWEAVVKCDFFDSDRSVDQNETTDLTFGVSYFFAYLTKIQLNYIYTDDRIKNSNHLAAVQMQIFF